MKNLYHKNKGKVYPSPSSSSYSSCDALSAFKLLPVAILALASVLSLEDREVLAYLITRSMNSTNPSSMIEEKKKSKKSNHAQNHKTPIFDCGCFDCYTSYWFRWDSSPNRELIHQAIEAFEEHLTKGEISKKNGNSRGKKRDKMGRRVKGKIFDKEGNGGTGEEKGIIVISTDLPTVSFVLKESDDFPVSVSDKSDDMLSNNEVQNCDEEAEVDDDDDVMTSGELNEPSVDETFMKFPASVHKGLVRKVLPDVMGLFNSRLWNLWSPKV